ncbi:MAG: hypothetical protein J2P28_20545, partial [Actinobacteria bacterium]|nr:hypothetical protein [Actinomycetota bacterium]
MKVRLIAAVAALVAAVGVAGWGVASAAHGRHPNAGSTPRITFTPAPTTSTPSTSPSTTTANLTAGLRQVFHQAFTAPLDRSVWGTCYPWASGAGGCTSFTNPEYEWYLPSQVKVSGGALRLTAELAPTQGTTSTGQAKTYGCRSGMVTSYPGFRFEYGYVSMVAKVP